MGGCQNYGPSLGTLNTRCGIIIGIEKGAIMLTATQIQDSTSTITGQEMKHRGRDSVFGPHAVGSSGGHQNLSPPG